MNRTIDNPDNEHLTKSLLRQSWRWLTIIILVGPGCVQRHAPIGTYCCSEHAVGDVQHSFNSYISATAAHEVTFYQGDRLGFNIVMDLKADNSFCLRAYSCLGSFGSASGRWKNAGRILQLTPVREEGFFISNDYRQFQIVPWNSGFAIVRSEDFREFCFSGPTLDTCMRPEELIDFAAERFK
jgi:hypothetical protein